MSKWYRAHIVADKLVVDELSTQEELTHATPTAAVRHYQAELNKRAKALARQAHTYRVAALRCSFTGPGHMRYTCLCFIRGCAFYHVARGPVDERVKPV